MRNILLCCGAVIIILYDQVDWIKREGTTSGAFSFDGWLLEIADRDVQPAVRVSEPHQELRIGPVMEGKSEFFQRLNS